MGSVGRGRAVSRVVEASGRAGREAVAALGAVKAAVAAARRAVVAVRAEFAGRDAVLAVGQATAAPAERISSKRQLGQDGGEGL